MWNRTPRDKAVSPIDAAAYNRDFRAETSQCADGSRQFRAFQMAVESRRHEIDLYWSRATYFWAFSAATLAAFGALQTQEVPERRFLSVVAGCLGIVFSFAWICVNKGSKRWLENWEKHVELLEDEVIGPLFKTLPRRPVPRTNRQKLGQIFTGPSEFSVTKINAIVSIVVTFLLWPCLVIRAVGPLSPTLPWDPWLVCVILGTILSCIAIAVLGRSDEVNFETVIFRRRIEVEVPAESDSRGPASMTPSGKGTGRRGAGRANGDAARRR